jgi:hypothetical protein
MIDYDISSLNRARCTFLRDDRIMCGLLFIPKSAGAPLVNRNHEKTPMNALNHSYSIHYNHYKPL